MSFQSFLDFGLSCLSMGPSLAFLKILSGNIASITKYNISCPKYLFYAYTFVYNNMQYT
jgi:hypothetical protein